MRHEEWRPTHHPNYDVSNYGRVRSRARGGCKILKPGIASHGYPTVDFGRVMGSQCVHRLVAAAFLGPCPEGQEVRHKDDDRANPRLDNLEYGTRHENIMDAVQRGRWNRPRKVTDLQRAAIRQRASHESRKALASEFGVCRQLIDRIVNAS